MNVFWNCTILIIIFTFSFIFKNNINLYYLFLHHYFCGSFFFVPSFLLSSVLSFSLTMLHVRCCPRVRWFSDRSWIWYITDDEIHSSQRIWPGQFAPPPNLVPGPTPLPVWRDCHDHMEYTQGSLANTRTLYLTVSLVHRPCMFSVGLPGSPNLGMKLPQFHIFSCLPFASCNCFCAKRDLASGYQWYHKISTLH